MASQDVGLGATYQQTSSLIQRKLGKLFLQSELNPRLGDAILDLGCGTGELSAHLAELVGQHGRVVGVDPDTDRIKVAQESYRTVRNLSFVEGSTSNFPLMGSESYNIIFSNLVLHWVSDKDEAFQNMFTSLIPGGGIFLLYNDRLPTRCSRFYHELNPENLHRILNAYHFQTRPVIEEMCTAAGFNILKSYDHKDLDLVFENGESLCSLLWATTQGLFDPKLVTEDRLASFCARYSSGEAGKIRFSPTENDFYSVLIAVKPAKTAEY